MTKINGINLVKADWDKHSAGILEAEGVSFPDAMRSSPDYLEKIIRHKKSLSWVGLDAEAEDVVGYHIAAPLEFFADHAGCGADADFGKNNSLYIASYVSRLGWRYKFPEFLSALMDEARIREYEKLKFHGRTRVFLPGVIESKFNGVVLAEFQPGQNFYPGHDFQEPYKYMEVRLK